MDRLIVKNFGPLKDVDIQLNKINIFIGENGSGKSVLGKIITIIMDLFNNSFDEKEMKKKFTSFNIDFINIKSEIQFISGEKVLFHLIKNSFLCEDNDLKSSYQQVITLEDNLKILKLKEHENQKILSDIEKDLDAKLKDKHKKNKLQSKLKKLNSEVNNNLVNLTNNEKEINNQKSNILKFSSQYIPAERNLISLFNRYVTTFITADIPLPKFLLNFSSQYTRAREGIQNLNFLNVEYQLKSGQEHIFYNSNESLLLEHSSSGIQSALPLFLTVKYFVNKYRGIIIEEPEQNLFPKAQSETIKYIIEQVSDANELFMMTHSPYVLSTLNILMMAYKAGNLNEEAKKEVSELFDEKQWINPENFSAYYLENGIARDIKGRTGLISDNEIDEISDDIQSEFEELLSIYREHKNDK